MSGPDESIPQILIITGIMAAGKSTIAQAIAERLPKSVHLRGDLFRRMITSGRADMTADAPAEALGQLRLRYRLATLVAAGYAQKGFTVVYQDILFGADLDAAVRALGRWRPGVVILAPRAEVAAERDAMRHKKGYVGWSATAFDEAFRRETGPRGLWVDNSRMSVGETVDFILANVGRMREGLPG